jgi:hypothetical protein
MTIVRRVLFVLLLAGVIWAGVQFVRANEAPVVIDLLAIEPFTVSVWQALLGCLGIGAAAAVAISLLEVTRYAFVARRYRRAAGRLESEIHQLRNLPLVDEGESSEGDPADLAVPPGGSAAGRR